MHRRVLPILAAIFALNLIAPAHAGAVLDRIMERGYFTMSAEPAWPPFSWKDADGEYKGFDVDVTNEVARRLGVGVKLIDHILTWEQQTGGHWDGKMDISIGSMTPTAKRAENLDFPVDYYYTIAALAVHRDNTTIKTPADASGKRIGALKAATYDLYLRRVPFDIKGMPPLVYKIDNPVVVNYENEEDALAALAKGDGVELDAVVNYLPALMAMVNKGMPFRIIGQPLYRAPQSVAIEPGDPELAAKLKEIVDGMHADVTLTNLSMKWFEVDLTKQ
jgi:polar amino acid transport system substrate-binding protein